MNNETIWLAYVGLPYTTGAYYERALRKQYKVVTIGPKPSEELIKNWNLEVIRHEIKAHDLDLSYTPDMAQIWRQYSEVFKPSLYLWIESAGGHFPQNLDAIQCPKACIFIDSHINLDYQLEWAKHFDYVFVAQLSYVEEFRKRGLNAHWLPLACDPEVHIPQILDPIYDIGFVGSVSAGSDRQRYLNALAGNHKVHYERSFLQEMARTFSQSKIVFNNAVGKTDLNMRFFEAMSCGSLLLSDMSRDSGQNIMFEPHHDYALYNEGNIIEVARYYLEDELARKSVAKRGQDLALAAHTYQDRVTHLLEVVSGKYIRTYNPYEWRDLANSRVTKKNAEINQKPFSQLIDINSIARSFIIPVLDYSPASIFNIKTLLDDLSQIGGEVIIIFNNEQIANEIKHHPRINHYAILKENVGVARAWNMGLDLCRTDYAFILNADLHITNGVIEQLQEALKILPQAAIVGPQGAYFDFEQLKDHIHLDKGTFNTCMEVDAVSGFLFGVKTEPFKNKSLQFENDYTPCYFEEWDLGLQIKAAGLKSYVVPLEDYEHHWSGSIRSYRQIAYYDRAQTSKQIQMRNAILFQNKWRHSISAKNDTHFLRSLLFSILAQQMNIALDCGHKEEAQKYLESLEERFANQSELVSLRNKFQSIFNKD